MTRNGSKIQRLVAASALVAFAALGHAQHAAGPVEEAVLEKLPPDARAVLESLSPTRTGDGGDRGIALVNREWGFTYGHPVSDNSPPTVLFEAHPDLEGNIILSGISLDTFLLKIFKLDGSLNGDAPPAGPIWEIDIDDVMGPANANIETDLDGLIYVHTVSSNGENSALLKMAPSGGTPLWITDQTGAVGDGTDHDGGMALDPDGTPFVAFRSSSTAITVRRIDALSGVIAWHTDIEGSDAGGGNCVPGVPFTNAPKIITDKQGDLWITTTGQIGPLSAQFIWQVDAVSGRILQCGTVMPDEPMTLSLLDFVLSPDGRLLSCGTTGPEIAGEDSYLSSFEQDLGQPAVHRVGGFGVARFDELQVDRTGRVHALGRSNDGNYLKYLRLTGSEFAEESRTPNSPAFLTVNSKLAIDRIGNPYIMFYDSANAGSLRTIKLNGMNSVAEIIWGESTDYPGFVTFPQHLIVDAGGSVFSVTAGVTSGAQNWFAAVEKHSQPYLSVPIAYKSNPVFQIEEAGPRHGQPEPLGGGSGAAGGPRLGDQRSVHDRAGHVHRASGLLRQAPRRALEHGARRGHGGRRLLLAVRLRAIARLPPRPLRREALPRFEQSTDSGVFNVRLPPSNYASPGLVDVLLCNPGPGGGPTAVDGRRERAHARGGPDAQRVDQGRSLRARRGGLLQRPAACDDLRERLAGPRAPRAAGPRVRGLRADRRSEPRRYFCDRHVRDQAGAADAINGRTSS